MTQPSGWYDDPADTSRLRYWDGILWTDRTVPKESPTAGASTIGRTVDPYAAPGAPGAPGSSVQPPSYPPALTPYGQPPAGRDYGAAPTYQWRPSGPTTPDGVPLAQWWQRLLASILDSIIVQVVGAVLAAYAAAARKLRDFFVEKGVTPDRITYQGFGDTAPLYSAKHIFAGKNRRFDIYLTR